MIKVKIEIECDNWEDVNYAYRTAQANGVFSIEIDGEFEEFTIEDIEAREIAEAEEQAIEDSQEDATEKGMY